jgi:mono/diheme cytochrome c family protein
VKKRPFAVIVAAAAVGLTALAAIGPSSPAPAAAGPNAKGHVAPDVARGEYLVKIMVCNDCHTPWTMGPRGPEPDMSRMLSGHPQDLVVPPPPAAQGPWIWSGAASMTAFAGPWGVSFAANLTPDPETGLGRWTEDTFIQAIRNGKHEGVGRPILPPMPAPWYRNATDEDLRAIFAYLHSLTPIHNRVPQPIDPPEAQ